MNPEQGVATLRNGICGSSGLTSASRLQIVLAEALSVAGRVSKAVFTVDELLAGRGVGRGEDEIFRFDLLRCRGELLAKQGAGLDESEADLAEAVDRARKVGALLFGVRAVATLARLLAASGRANEARELLGPIHARFVEADASGAGREASVVLDALA